VRVGSTGVFAVIRLSNTQMTFKRACGVLLRCRRHPYQYEGTRATAGGNGAKAMPKTISKVVGMLGADLKITPVDGGKRCVELGRFRVVLVDCCP